ncbi:MAG: hypothetical protein A2312_04525 [Candidatus Staskawiczbacteria bacterium RIFOXYB2_FULL_32_9]|uniref:Uncharacterized protein n=1 Tax=Candidatus Staskawiczbacteria bacterium RIFOXYD1_FULL_32_13 TaxID=1802234 RepID=A0A1G2JMZ1_9BACT|nr:MAG: hypothetical protein UR22_C0003G0005 [Parcubacteria group bacterium GW2011_GWC2_32_10]OGZ80420.1 MAG: hypothetical protein A2360_00950 [Candidatus Staskawiczbacteria bacterium RIFOXYB1_FULL_32_11]OGZ82647.1 MAG: hypothetical protein A2312_04525 [Candidatus Staskawiczbacteria bacterium RIFOXYB2_FULL_32_9]OGZ88494.1 MAG: hypothetical protein A2561_01490 [Candidatus Staskawiczbacteria bacterium RIFOXYD1_FULL_32_13]
MTFGWKKWTKKNLNRLESLLANGMPIENVRFRGRKKACIRRKARELGLIPTRGFPPFTKAQQKKLRQLIADNCPPEQIAEFEMLGKETKPRTVHNIRKWMGRLRLVNKNRSRSARKRKILTKRESRTLNAFLREHSTEFSIQQIARKFGIKKGTVDAKQRKLGVKPPFSIVLKIPSTRRKYLAGMCKRSAKMLAEFDFNITQREQKLIKLYQAMIKTNDNRSVPLEEKTCKVCQRSWLKHHKFFYHNEVKNNGYTTWHFSNVCVICEAKRRHNKRLKNR